MIKKLFVILGFLLPLIGQGQMIYDTLDLEAVEILSRQFDQSAGYKVLAVDTAALQSRSSGSLAELLSGSTPMFVKGYGPGSLASTSIRGASAAHTQVIWNGMNINSPMPGQTDFSTVPVFFIDRATMYFGAGSVQQTSGGLGGAIDLETKPTWQNKLRIGLQQDAGSFKTYKTLFSADAGNEVFQSSTRLLRGSSENDFPYLNIAVSRDDPPREIRKNAAWQQQGLLQQLYWKPGTRTLLSGKVWLQKNHREIPANILVQVPDGNESLDENFVRAVLNARYFFPSASLSAQSGYLHNRMNYRNKISGINSVNLIDGSLNNLKYEYQGIRNLLISASAGIDLYRARSDNFGGSHSRRQGTACLGLNYQATGRMHLNMMLREQIINGEWAPVAPALGMNYLLLEKEALNFTANIARNFHAPTLNDLYWTPGGNPDLGFEKGFSFDLGLKYDKQIGSYRFHAAITHFYADINNWIIWLPDSVFSYWTPANLKRVVSRGIESEAAVSANYGNWNWKYTLFYSYTSAKNQTRSGSADLSAGRQLIYVPENLLNQNLYVRCRGFSVSWHLNLTGRRYTASDNSRYLPAFSTQDLNVAKQVNLKKSIFELRLIVNNILNENYQVVAWHPMPGRSFTFSLKYIFNQNH